MRIFGVVMGWLALSSAPSFGASLPIDVCRLGLVQPADSIVDRLDAKVKLVGLYRRAARHFIDHSRFRNGNQVKINSLSSRIWFIVREMRVCKGQEAVSLEQDDFSVLREIFAVGVIHTRGFAQALSDPSFFRTEANFAKAIERRPELAEEMQVAGTEVLEYFESLRTLISDVNQMEPQALKRELLDELLALLGRQSQDWIEERVIRVLVIAGIISNEWMNEMLGVIRLLEGPTGTPLVSESFLSTVVEEVSREIRMLEFMDRKDWGLLQYFFWDQYIRDRFAE